MHTPEGIPHQRAARTAKFLHQIGARKAGRVHEVAACRKRVSRAVWLRATGAGARMATRMKNKFYSARRERLFVSPWKWWQRTWRSAGSVQNRAGTCLAIAAAILVSFSRAA